MSALVDGQLAAVATACCWALTALFFSAGGRRVGSQAVNLTRLAFACLYLGLAHQWQFGVAFPVETRPFQWQWLAISSVLGLVIGDTALFKTFELLGARLSTLVMASVPIFSVALSWLFLGEHISRGQAGAIAITLAGIVVVVGERQGAASDVLPGGLAPGLALGIVGALGQAGNLITAKYAMAGGYSALSATVVRIWFAAAVLWLIASVRGDVPRIMGAWEDRRALALTAAGAVAGPFLGIWLSLYAVTHAPVGIASALMALPPVILLPIDVLVLKRPVSPRAWIGTVAAVAGAAALVAGAG